jgi:primosomal replication protein N''
MHVLPVPDGAPAPWDVPAVEEVQPSTSGLVCVQGHSLSVTDLICPVCGAEPADTVTASEDNGPVLPNNPISSIGDWELLERLSNPDEIPAVYSVRNSSGTAGQLTWYGESLQPSRDVLSIVSSLPREHFPAIYETGTHAGTTFVVSESLDRATPEDIRSIFSQQVGLVAGVSEMASALDALAESGIRHRGLCPSSFLIRSRNPIDFVLSGFEYARQAEFDLELSVAVPVSRYSAPEVVTDYGMTAASDWWSFGIVLLEFITNGACFVGVRDQAFLLEVLTNGVTLPDAIDDRTKLLLRGLLTRDRTTRWQRRQVEQWCDGESPEVFETSNNASENNGQAILLGGKQVSSVNGYALRAADASSWDEAAKQYASGQLVTWLATLGLDSKLIASLRDISHLDGIDINIKLMVVLKSLVPKMPLVYNGSLVTPHWMGQNPELGYQIITSKIPDLLPDERWLSLLRDRSISVRNSIERLRIDIVEDDLRVCLLALSRQNLERYWEARRRLMPEPAVDGIAVIMDNPVMTDEDLIILRSASPSQFLMRESVVSDAEREAKRLHISTFDITKADSLAVERKSALYEKLSQLTKYFAMSGIVEVDQWVDEFRADRRTSLLRALVILSIPENQWTRPDGMQQYASLLKCFTNRISATVVRGPLVRMTITAKSPRIDLSDFDTDNQVVTQVIDAIVSRSTQTVSIHNPLSGTRSNTLDDRLQRIFDESEAFRRDSGIDPIYIAFPFIVFRDVKPKTRTRIAPLVLWPASLVSPRNTTRVSSVRFDSSRSESIRINPALSTLIGQEKFKQCQIALENLLSRSGIRAADVVDHFGRLFDQLNAFPARLPSADITVPMNHIQLFGSSVLFCASFAGQAVAEDLAEMRRLDPRHSALASTLGFITQSPIVNEQGTHGQPVYLLGDADPSQEMAVRSALRGPGHLVEGPPGTGKSQTIVNLITNAICAGKTVLVVCQKRAALEVVEKRLAAEGLGGRTVLLDDVAKDRKFIIHSVREQVEVIQNQFVQPSNGSDKSRLKAASDAVKRLEETIDRDYLQSKQVDPVWLDNFEGTVSSLIGLTDQGALLSVPAIRSTLSSMSESEADALAESCARVASVWKGSRYESSPFKILHPFPPNPGTMDAFSHEWQRFYLAEENRDQVINETRECRITITSPAAEERWIQTYGSSISQTDDQTKRDYLKWCMKRQPINFDTSIAKLTQIASSLSDLDPLKWHSTLSPVLASMKPSDISSLRVRADLVVNAPEWRRFLDLRCILALLNVQSFLSETNDASVHGRFDVLITAIDFHNQFDALFQQWVELAEEHHCPPGTSADGFAIVDRIKGLLVRLESVKRLKDVLSKTATASDWEKSLELDDVDGPNGMLKNMEAAVGRAFALESSLSALSDIQNLTQDTRLRLTDVIRKGQSTHDLRSKVKDHLPFLRSYMDFCFQKESLSEPAMQVLSGFRPLEAELDKPDVSDNLGQRIRTSIMAEARYAALDRMLRQHPALASTQDQQIADITQLGTNLSRLRLAQQAVLASSIDRQSLGTRQQWEAITRQSGPRRKTLREFFVDGSQIGLLTLRPVWLTNPEAASQLLPLTSGLFDIVVYDEASQMQVEFAVPTLLRSKLVTVSGDEKQMPPTSFFSRLETSSGLDTDDENEESQDDVLSTWNSEDITTCPDLLSLARSVFDWSRLSIHYRSQYRELIGHSNAAFYKNSLNVPVRQPAALVEKARPIEWMSINGLYGNSINEREASAVVEWLATFWEQEGLPPSVGVVTFNLPQAERIRELVQLRADSDVSFNLALLRERDRMDNGEAIGFFIKNVENVQGDERDVILFSTTFGPDETGAFRRNFGALGKAGGERRLNVATTRAKQKIVVFSSMPIDKISDFLATTRPPAAPKDYLQSYLAYAKSISEGNFEQVSQLTKRLSGTSAGSSILSKRVDDWLRVSIKSQLEAHGLKVTEPPCDDIFSVDLAIENNAGDAFLVGIQCYRPSSHLLERAIHREIWRPTVMSRVYPRIHMVSPYGWLTNREREFASLISSIEQVVSSQECAE